MTTQTVTLRKTEPFRLKKHISASVASLIAAKNRIVLARKMARERAILAQLPDHLLKDIGLSRYDAVKEAEKDFWDLPAKGR